MELLIGDGATQMLGEIRESYVLTSVSAVERYLGSRPAVSEALIEALPRLKRCFGSATLAIRMHGEEDGTESLYAMALWPGAVQDARAATERFDNDWWLAKCASSSDCVVFTYELV